MNTNMIEQSRRLYEQGVAPMIRRKFPEYESRIAAGMAGEGSDCFGYDDRISQDHDYGVGVCLWLTDEDAKQIGSALQSAYQQAAAMWLSGNRAAGASPEGQSGRLHHLHQRRGAQTIRQFYYANLNVMIDPAEPAVTDGIWFYTDEWRFAAAVNGAVFRDDLGQFTRIRELLLRYYPDRIWRMRLANALHNYASAMQANYARYMARKDPVAAAFCKTRSIDAAMDILFLIRRRFAPYYKWKFRAFQDLEGSGEIAELLEKAAVMEPDPSAWEDHEYSSLRINEKDPLVMLFEKIAALLVRELKDAGLTDSSEVFLEAHCGKVSAGIR